MTTPGMRDAWAAVAAEHPDRAAVVVGTERRTFSEVVQGADEVAARLGSEGVAAGDRVALVLPNGADFFEALAGALAIGAVPLTIDDRASADEVHRAVDTTDAKAVIHLRADAEKVTRALKQIQRRWRPAQLEVEPAAAARRAVNPTIVEGQTTSPTSAVATTGTVVLVAPTPGSSEAVTRLDIESVLHAASSVGPDGNDTHLVLGSLARGVGLVGSLTTLGAGATVVLPAVRARLEDLIDTITREGVGRVTVDRTMRAEARMLADRFPGMSIGVATAGADEADRDEAGTDAPAAIDTDRGLVDPSRIETRVAAHRGVAECRVVGLATRNGPPAIVALVVVADGHYLDAAELRAWARHKLDMSETPRLWLFVDAFAPDATDEQLRRLALAQLQQR